ncbi:uncharacterized protein [Montipora foliosa]|uniref:uncharacterized protein isoform X1 n=1 Tax=Montipora foliosa TaxID=591990 RepID=UPI0035F185A2
MASPCVVTPCVVKDSAGKYFCALEEACDAYLSRLWPDWKTTDRTYMFPPAFPFRYKAPTGAASGAVRLSKSEEQDVKGDTAELRIFRSLDKFGRETKQPMVVITKFEFTEFIKEVLKQYLGDEEVQAMFADLSEIDLSGEIDFLVMHRRIGFIIIEAKATEKFKTNRYLDAKKQLQVGEKFVRSLLEAKGLDIPVFKVIAMPHVVDEGRDASDYIDLRKIHVESVNHDDEDSVRNFEQWWKEHFTEKSFNKDEGEFLKLISVLVGQRTAISATAQILSVVFKTIDEQSFLERSHTKMATKGASRSGVVVKATDVAGLRILAKQFLFLNIEQLGLWEGPRHQLFCGAPGSGKTILLQYKALECAKRGENVLLLLPPPLDKLYKEFFTRNEISNGIITIVTFDNLANFLSFSLCTSAKPFHVFVDEFQILLFMSTVLDAFTEFLTQHQWDDFYQWITYDVNQMLLTNEIFGMRRASNANIPGYLAQLCSGHNFFHAPSLTTVMRCTSEVYEFLKHYLKFSFGRPPVDGPQISRQYWHHPVYLGHQICGPQVIVEGKITYGSREERFADCYKIIKDEINEWAKEGDVYFYHKIAILVAAPQWIDELVPIMSRDGIPVCRIGDSDDGVVLDNADYARSYEWPVVIAICGHLKAMQNYIPSSRAVTRLVMLWWK